MATIPLPLPAEELDLSEMSAEDLLEYAARRAIASGFTPPPLIPVRWRTHDADYLVNIHFTDYSPPTADEDEIVWDF